jgi:DNA polymerase-3 subunit delta'
MSFKDFPDQQQGIQLLQRSLERGRLGHGYLFTGHQLGTLEGLARSLAKTLNCLHPIRSEGVGIDCCDKCLNCQKIDHGNHADVHWVRPESASRVVTIDQMRELMQQINLKPTEAEYKVATIVAADRLNSSAANAFLKTLEEPPPKSILILLTTEPQRLLETILSRCLRLNFAGEGQRPLDPEQMAWLVAFSEMAAKPQKSLLGRYRLMDVLLRKLNQMKETISESLTARSPLQKYQEVEKNLQERWEKELKAAIEAEYRRQRADLLAVLQNWLRDVWLRTLARPNEQKSEVRDSRPADRLMDDLLIFPKVAATSDVAQRISAKDAMENLRIMEQLQRWLATNVQEALAMEVGLLKLHL